MSDDWKPGDLALCVRGGKDPSSDIPSAQPGRIYTVANVTNCGPFGIGLGFRELPDSQDWAYGAEDFRKIRPHTPDEQDAETIRLLNGAPAKEPIHA